MRSRSPGGPWLNLFWGIAVAPCSESLVAFMSLGFFHRGRNRSFSTESAGCSRRIAGGPRHSRWPLCVFTSWSSCSFACPFGESDVSHFADTTHLIALRRLTLVPTAGLVAIHVTATSREHRVSSGETSSRPTARGLRSQVERDHVLATSEPAPNCCPRPRLLRRQSYSMPPKVPAARVGRTERDWSQTKRPAPRRAAEPCDA